MMLRQIIFSFLRQYLFWLVFFALCRLVFLIFNLITHPTAIDFESVLAFWYALPLDNSAASYLLVFPFLLLFFQSLFPSRSFYYANYVYNILAIGLLSIISSAELGIFDEWKTKLNYKALTYLERPYEVIQSTKAWIAFSVIFSFLFLVLVGIWLLKRFVMKKTEHFDRNLLVSVLFFLITPVLISFGVRGGFQSISINQSDVYYSNNQFNNLLAVNSAWNLIYSMEQNRGFVQNNPFVYMPDKESKAIVDSLHRVEKDSTVYFLDVNNRQANIVVIILESWSADVVKSCGGYDSLTPNFEKLCKEGYLFTEIISTGTVSDQGMAAILSGYPAQPTVSIIKQESKYANLRCLTSGFQKDGYLTSFIFGGQLSYGNIKGYIYYNKFDDIADMNDFESDIPRGRLSIADEYVYEEFLHRLNNYKTPFFSFMFTGSSHSPFDMPMPKKAIQHGGEYKEYFNAIYYSDSCLGSFIENAKKQQWYENTLFVMIADHSHSTPRGYIWNSGDRRRIPLLFFGPLVKPEFKARSNDKLYAQIDFPATLLKQFGYSAESFRWSKNMMNPHTKNFAYYSFDNGIGWVSPDGKYAWDHDMNRFFENEYRNRKRGASDLINGKAYLQELFREYSEF
jgi:phosphoglycerol transferase MdoB-like AlkP superfamily enzyme